jgi:lipopolysaccharide transport system permease protein
VSVIEKTAPEAAAAPAPVRDQRVTTIGPATKWPTLDMSELWRYRELAAVFVWRDIKVRYKQTFIGVAWAVLQPVITTVIFTLVFGRYGNFKTDVPYPVHVLSGMMIWTYFAASLNGASSSIPTSKSLVTKVYFPRLLLPLGGISTPLVDFCIALPVLIGMIVYYDLIVGVQVLLVPLFLLLAAVTAFGVGLFATVASVRFRDVPYAIPFVIQIWFFLSPIIYQSSFLPQRYQWVLNFNPMTAAITGFRWAFFGDTPPTASSVVIGTAVAIAFLVGGLAFFRRAEPSFADTI